MSNSTLLGDYLTQGSGAPSGAPPVASGVSAFYYDATGDQLYVYNWTATAWQAVGGGGSSFSSLYDSGVLALTKPVAANFTLSQNANLGGAATLVDMNSRGITLLAPENTHNAQNIAKVHQAVANTSTFTATALIQMDNLGEAGNSWGGLYLDDTSGNYTIFGWSAFNSSSHWNWWMQFNYNSSDAYQSDAFIGVIDGQIKGPVWLRLKADGTNLKSYTSMDGETWCQRGSVSQTSFLGTLRNVGLAVNKDSGGTSPNDTWPAQMNCYSWTNTNP